MELFLSLTWGCLWTFTWWCNQDDHEPIPHPHSGRGSLVTDATLAPQPPRKLYMDALWVDGCPQPRVQPPGHVAVLLLMTQSKRESCTGPSADLLLPHVACSVHEGTMSTVKWGCVTRLRGTQVTNWWFHPTAYQWQRKLTATKDRTDQEQADRAVSSSLVS